MSIISRHICVCNRCELKSNQAVFVGRGKKTEYRLINSQKKVIDKYIVDDCLLNSKTIDEKCDYLFVVKKNKHAYFVECKGSDILKAVNQIDSSIRILHADFSDFVMKGRIVATKVHSPDLRNQSYRRLREKLNGELEIRNNSFSETV